jgi:hypothetical protein
VGSVTAAGTMTSSRRALRRWLPAIDWWCRSCGRDLKWGECTVACLQVRYDGFCLAVQHVVDACLAWPLSFTLCSGAVCTSELKHGVATAQLQGHQHV